MVLLIDNDKNNPFNDAEKSEIEKLNKDFKSVEYINSKAKNLNQWNIINSIVLTKNPYIDYLPFSMIIILISSDFKWDKKSKYITGWTKSITDFFDKRIKTLLAEKIAYDLNFSFSEDLDNIDVIVKSIKIKDIDIPVYCLGRYFSFDEKNEYFCYFNARLLQSKFSFYKYYKNKYEICKKMYMCSLENLSLNFFVLCFNAFKEWYSKNIQKNDFSKYYIGYPPQNGLWKGKEQFNRFAGIRNDNIFSYKKEHEPQKGKSLDERIKNKKNIKDALEIKLSENFSNKKLLFIDDIVTTKITIEAFIEVAIEKGFEPQNILVISISKAYTDSHNLQSIKCEECLNSFKITWQEKLIRKLEFFTISYKGSKCENCEQRRDYDFPTYNFIMN